jgi:hypothetical protein
MLRPDFPGVSKVFMSNDTLIREVDEELRRDRMHKLWRQTGPYVIGAAVAVVLLVAGYEGWNWYQSSTSSKSSDAFYAAAALADGTDFEAARTALDKVIAEGSGAYPALAQFREAALLAQQQKTDEALAAYDSLATSLASPHLRELALLLGASLLIDRGDVPGVEQRLGGSMTPDAPLRNAAREVLGLTQYKAGQLDAAMTTLQALVDDPLTSNDLRNRAQIYVQQLLAEGATPVVKEPAAASAEDAPAADVPAAGEASSPAP